MNPPEITLITILLKISFMSDKKKLNIKGILIQKKFSTDNVYQYILLIILFIY